MGIYRAESSSSDAVVVRHEGEDDHTIEIHAGRTGALAFGAFAPVPQFFQDQVAEGKRYYVSISFSEVKDAPAPAISTESTPTPKVAKAAAAKKPGKPSVSKAVIADLEDKIEGAAKAVKKAVKKAPIKSAPKSQPKKAATKKS